MSWAAMTEAQNKATATHRLEMRNHLSELDRLSAFARRIGAEHGLNAEQIFTLELCLEEAVANIIMHGGSRDAAARHISVSLVGGEPDLTLCLEDDGRPFDPTSAPEPAAILSLEDAAIGGRGISLIRKLTSRMRYEHSDGHNRLMLSFGPRVAAGAGSL
jgi:serine/threonine-protein kinase RsbW